MAFINNRRFRREQKIYGDKLEKIKDLANSALKTLGNKNLLDEILKQQLLIFQKTYNDSSLKWNFLIEEISKSEKI